MTSRPDAGAAQAPDLSTLRFSPDERQYDFVLHPSPSFLIDPETRRIIAANDAAASLYGWTREEMATMSLDDIRPPEVREELASNIDRMKLSRGSRWYATQHWRHDGEPIEVEVLSQPMELEGRPVWRSIVIDVTARVRAEALFRGVAEQSLTGIYVMQDDRFVYMNPRLAEMFGYTVDEVMQLADPLSVLSNDARALIMERAANRLRGDLENSRYEVHATRRDGSPIVVEIHGSSLMLRGRVALLGTVLDVTARVTADATLAESERRFRAAFEQSMSGMAITAPNGRWLRVNRALCDMLGYTPEEMTGFTFHELTHPEDVAENVEQLDALLRGEIPGYRLDKRFLHKDGSIVWASLNVALVRDESGQPLYMVSQANDVTARRRAETALGESEMRLRQAQKMEAVGRLAGGVAHDFNNLLTVIRSNAELGVDLAREGLGALEEFSEISSAVERAASLTRQLLAFSRQQVLAPTALSLNDVVIDAERMLRRVIGVDVMMTTQLDPDAGEVIADRGQLEQVLMNLVVNARDSMPDGGRVVITTRRDDTGMVSLSVTDSGSGMDAETKARAFEPFFTTKPLGKGTGLGLSTVYGIAQQSGGDVSIRSELGTGTTVTVSLPSSRISSPKPPRITASDETRPSESSQEQTTILLVEDEPGVRAVVRRILDRFGYRVVEAQNGADAFSLWMLHRQSIHLVLSDAFMPVMGGSELADRLRAAGAEVPVLFMSGYPDGERGGGVPADADLIRKPFSAEELRERLARVLAQAGRR